MAHSVDLARAESLGVEAVPPRRLRRLAAWQLGVRTSPWSGPLPVRAPTSVVFGPEALAQLDVAEPVRRRAPGSEERVEQVLHVAAVEAPSGHQIPEVDRAEETVDHRP